MENNEWFLCFHSFRELMKLKKKYTEILIYSVSMAVLLLVVKWLEAHFIVFNYRLGHLARTETSQTQNKDPDY